MFELQVYNVTHVDFEEIKRLRKRSFPFKRPQDRQTVIIYNNIMYVRFIDVLLRFEKL